MAKYSRAILIEEEMTAQERNEQLMSDMERILTALEKSNDNNLDECADWFREIKNRVTNLHIRMLNHESLKSSIINW